MDFINYVNIGIIIAIITIIETCKRILLSFKIEFPKWIWILIVLCAGVPAGTIAFGVDNKFDNFNIWEFIQYCFLYSAAASLIYQMGKTGIGSFVGFNENKDSENK